MSDDKPSAGAEARVGSSRRDDIPADQLAPRGFSSDTSYEAAAFIAAPTALVPGFDPLSNFERSKAPCLDERQLDQSVPNLIIQASNDSITSEPSRDTDGSSRASARAENETAPASVVSSAVSTTSALQPPGIQCTQSQRTEHDSDTVLGDDQRGRTDVTSSLHFSVCTNQTAVRGVITSKLHLRSEATIDEDKEDSFHNQHNNLHQLSKLHRNYQHDRSNPSVWVTTQEYAYSTKNNSEPRGTSHSTAPQIALTSVHHQHHQLMHQNQHLSTAPSHSRTVYHDQPRAAPPISRPQFVATYTDPNYVRQLPNVRSQRTDEQLDHESESTNAESVPLLTALSPMASTILSEMNSLRSPMSQMDQTNASLSNASTSRRVSTPGLTELPSSPNVPPASRPTRGSHPDPWGGFASVHAPASNSLYLEQPQTLYLPQQSPEHCQKSQPLARKRIIEVDKREPFQATEQNFRVDQRHSDQLHYRFVTNDRAESHQPSQDPADNSMPSFEKSSEGSLEQLQAAALGKRSFTAVHLASHSSSEQSVVTFPPRHQLSNDSPMISAGPLVSHADPLPTSTGVPLPRSARAYSVGECQPTGRYGDITLGSLKASGDTSRSDECEEMPQKSFASWEARKDAGAVFDAPAQSMGNGQPALDLVYFPDPMKRLDHTTLLFLHPSSSLKVPSPDPARNMPPTLPELLVRLSQRLPTGFLGDADRTSSYRQGLSRKTFTLPGSKNCEYCTGGGQDPFSDFHTLTSMSQRLSNPLLTLSEARKLLAFTSTIRETTPHALAGTILASEAQYLISELSQIKRLDLRDRSVSRLICGIRSESHMSGNTFNSPFVTGSQGRSGPLTPVTPGHSVAAMNTREPVSARDQVDSHKRGSQEIEADMRSTASPLTVTNASNAGGGDNTTQGVTPWESLPIHARKSLIERSIAHISRLNSILDVVIQRDFPLTGVCNDSNELLGRVWYRTASPSKCKLSPLTSKVPQSRSDDVSSSAPGLSRNPNPSLTLTPSLRQRRALLQTVLGDDDDMRLDSRLTSPQGKGPFLPPAAVRDASETASIESLNQGAEDDPQQGACLWIQVVMIAIGRLRRLLGLLPVYKQAHRISSSPPPSQLSVPHVRSIRGLNGTGSGLLSSRTILDLARVASSPSASQCSPKSLGSDNSEIHEQNISPPGSNMSSPFVASRRYSEDMSKHTLTDDLADDLTCTSPQSQRSSGPVIHFSAQSATLTTLSQLTAASATPREVESVGRYKFPRVDFSLGPSPRSNAATPIQAHSPVATPLAFTPSQEVASTALQSAWQDLLRHCTKLELGLKHVIQVYTPSYSAYVHSSLIPSLEYAVAHQLFHHLEFEPYYACLQTNLPSLLQAYLGRPTPTLRRLVKNAECTTFLDAFKCSTVTRSALHSYWLLIRAFQLQARVASLSILVFGRYLGPQSTPELVKELHSRGGFHPIAELIENMTRTQHTLRCDETSNGTAMRRFLSCVPYALGFSESPVTCCPGIALVVELGRSYGLSKQGDDGGDQLFDVLALLSAIYPSQESMLAALYPGAKFPIFSALQELCSSAMMLMLLNFVTLSSDAARCILDSAKFGAPDAETAIYALYKCEAEALVEELNSLHCLAKLVSPPEPFSYSPSPLDASTPNRRPCIIEWIYRAFECTPKSEVDLNGVSHMLPEFELRATLLACAQTSLDFMSSSKSVEPASEGPLSPISTSKNGSPSPSHDFRNLSVGGVAHESSQHGNVMQMFDMVVQQMFEHEAQEELNAGVSCLPYLAGLHKVAAELASPMRAMMRFLCALRNVCLVGWRSNQQESSLGGIAELTVLTIARVLELVMLRNHVTLKLHPQTTEDCPTGGMLVEDVFLTESFPQDTWGTSYMFDFSDVAMPVASEYHLADSFGCCAMLVNFWDSPEFYTSRPDVATAAPSEIMSSLFKIGDFEPDVSLYNKNLQSCASQLCIWLWGAGTVSLIAEHTNARLETNTSIRDLLQSSERVPDMHSSLVALSSGGAAVAHAPILAAGLSDTTDRPPQLSQAHDTSTWTGGIETTVSLPMGTEKSPEQPDSEVLPKRSARGRPRRTNTERPSDIETLSSSKKPVRRSRTRMSPTPDVVSAGPVEAAQSSHPHGIASADDQPVRQEVISHVDPISSSPPAMLVDESDSSKKGVARSRRRSAKETMTPAQTDEPSGSLPSSQPLLSTHVSTLEKDMADRVNEWLNRVEVQGITRLMAEHDGGTQGSAGERTSVSSAAAVSPRQRRKKQDDQSTGNGRAASRRSRTNLPKPVLNMIRELHVILQPCPLKTQRAILEEVSEHLKVPRKHIMRSFRNWRYSARGKGRKNATHISSEFDDPGSDDCSESEDELEPDMDVQQVPLRSQRTNATNDVASLQLSLLTVSAPSAHPSLQNVSLIDVPDAALNAKGITEQIDAPTNSNERRRETKERVNKAAYGESRKPRSQHSNDDGNEPTQPPTRSLVSPPILERRVDPSGEFKHDMQPDNPGSNVAPTGPIWGDPLCNPAQQYQLFQTHADSSSLSSIHAEAMPVTNHWSVTDSDSMTAKRSFDPLLSSISHQGHCGSGIAAASDQATPHIPRETTLEHDTASQTMRPPPMLSKPASQESNGPFLSLTATASLIIPSAGHVQPLNDMPRGLPPSSIVTVTPRGTRVSSPSVHRVLSNETFGLSRASSQIATPNWANRHEPHRSGLHLSSSTMQSVVALNPTASPAFGRSMGSRSSRVESPQARNTRDSAQVVEDLSASETIQSMLNDNAFDSSRKRKAPENRTRIHAASGSESTPTQTRSPINIDYFSAHAQAFGSDAPGAPTHHLTPVAHDAAHTQTLHAYSGDAHQLEDILSPSRTLHPTPTLRQNGVEPFIGLLYLSQHGTTHRNTDATTEFESNLQPTPQPQSHTFREVYSSPHSSTTAPTSVPSQSVPSLTSLPPIADHQLNRKV